jgi:hypothetical protein
MITMIIDYNYDDIDEDDDDDDDDDDGDDNVTVLHFTFMVPCITNLI